MRYLTQGLIDFETTIRTLHVRDVYDWHKLVWKAFPGKNGQARNFLTRLDRQRDGFRLLIVSESSPVAPSDWPHELPAWQTKLVSDEFFRFKRYLFQLRANPTKRDSASRKRLPLKTDEELSAWIIRKAQQSGFVINNETVRVIKEGREWFQIEKRNTAGFHHSVDFSGTLVVTDSAKFQTAFEQGIGSAKAFGFGMLMLSPLSDERGKT